MPFTNPSDVSVGSVLTASRYNSDVVGNWNLFGGAWTDYTPTLSQGASSNIAKTLGYSKFLKIGRFVIYAAHMTATASGSAGSNVTLTLPATAATSVAVAIGIGYYDDSGTAAYGIVPTLASTTTIQFPITDGTGGGRIGTSPNIAVANNDILRLTIAYEAAS